MSPAFSYLSVLLSIILGLAIAEILQGYGTLLLSRASVKLYAPPLIWSNFGAGNLIALAQAGIPAEIVSVPLSGAAAPVAAIMILPDRGRHETPPWPPTATAR